MKKYLLLALLLALNFIFVGAQETDWIKVKDTIAAYVIDFPKIPEKGMQDVPTDKGIVKMNTYTLQPENDVNVIYMSSFTKYPSSFFDDGLITMQSQQNVLDGSVNGAVSNTKGKLISDVKILFNGYQGREIKILVNSSNVDYVIQMKIVLAGFKLYLAQVIYFKENKDNENAKRFFDSLELINIKE